MFAGLPDAVLVTLIGGVTGLALGLAARLGRFCTLGAIEDRTYGGSSVRMRMWGIAIGVTLVMVFAALKLGWFDPTEAFYLNYKWLPWQSVIGGGLFGYGMALAGNCGYGALARLGGGDLRSFLIVVVLGISAYATLSGPTAFIFDMAFPRIPAEHPQSYAYLAERLTGIDAAWFGILAGLAIMAYTLSDQEMRQDRSAILWGAVVGLAIAGGWIGTHVVSTYGFEVTPVVSHNFSAPIGETMLWIMLGESHAPTFAIGSVIGVWSGALIGSFMLGHFRWEACEDPRELRRQIYGAIMMGAGAVIAMGCTIGQGITAFGLLSYSAPVTMISIYFGAAFGLRHLIEGFTIAE